MPECLSENVVLDLLEGRLDPTTLTSVARHIDACASCRQLVADAGQGDDVPLRKGATLGRYVILDIVGAGAMGVVYAAYDPELDRKLALKLLRADLEDASELGLRLRREAQALAKLAHPNVVTVHDVGAVDGRVFLAIEFVDGGTLTRWLHTQERSWREILAMFRQVGEGLHAAHEAGLVHRDFKPDNVLVGKDGRPRVTDFGLARPMGSPALPVPPESSLALEVLVTPTGAIVGTPFFMAPEQRSGGEADARSDLYSFCVALHWALYGSHPSKGLTEGTRSVPGWLRRVLARGLNERPEDRHPDMRALLDALGHGPLVTPRRAVVAAGLLALGAIAFAVRPPPPCTGAEAAFGDVWDARHRETVRARFESAGATQTFSLIDRELGTFRDTWLAMHTDACQATRVRGEQSEALLDLRMRCLQDRRKQAAALVEILSEADATVINRAATTLGALGSMAGCADARALTSPLPLPEDPRQQAEIDRLSSQLARSHALYFASRMKEATEVARSALEPARATGYRPLEARLLYAEAHALKGQGLPLDAEKLAHQAAIAAEAARDDGTAADAFILLTYLTGFVQGHVDAGKQWAAYAAAALERLGGDTDREISLRVNEELLYWDDAPEHALELAERARALILEAHGPDDWRMAGAEEALGAISLDLGKAEQSVEHHRRAEALRERILGPDHPDLRSSWLNLAVALRLMGRPHEALALLRRVQESYAKRPEGNDAYLQHRLASILRDLGDFPGALEADRRALEQMEPRHRADEYVLSWPLLGLGQDLLGLDRPAEAVAPLERAVALRTPHVVPPELGEAELALALALRKSGKDPARARQLGLDALEHLRHHAERYGGWYVKGYEEAKAFVSAPERTRAGSRPAGCAPGRAGCPAPPG